jgi:hypothetical protein
LEVAMTVMPSEQGLEQAGQDHRVGDVGHLELVEAEQSRLPGRDLARDRHDGVGFRRRALGRELPARLCSRAWTSSMNSWKCTRRFLATGASAKNRSISIDLPRPTGPQM